jgi:hypothetical protein
VREFVEREARVRSRHQAPWGQSQYRPSRPKPKQKFFGLGLFLKHCGAGGMRGRRSYLSG